MEFKGTKGWENINITHFLKDESGCDVECVQIRDDEGNEVALVTYDMQTKEQGDAHAKLIAAAPELLESANEALKSIIHIKSEFPEITGHGGKAVFLLEKAINKALE